jgi:hypothetical protein
MDTPLEMSEARFQEMVTSAIERRDSEALSEAISRSATYCEKQVQDWEAIPDSTFQFLVDLLARDQVVEFEGAHYLFLLFRHEWARLSDLQRKTLLPVLGDAYKKPMAQMTRFVVCELLGEFYANAQALEFFKEFGKMQSEGSRLFVPHGLEHLIEEVVDPDVRAAALDFLWTFQSDSSERVREEAFAVIAAIRKESTE